MAAVGDHPQRCAKASRVLHAVLQRHPVVVRAPEAETRALDAVEVDAGIGGDERAPRRERVGVLRRSLEEGLGHLGIEAGGIGDAPPAERDGPAEPRTRDARPVATGEPAGPDDPQHGDRRLTEPGRGRDSGRSREHDAADGLRPAYRRPEGDEPAEGMADPRGGQCRFGLRHGEHCVGEGVEARRPADAARAAVARKLGHDHAPLGGQGRRDEPPVRGQAAQAVNE